MYDPDELILIFPPPTVEDVEATVKTAFKVRVFPAFTVIELVDRDEDARGKDSGPVEMDESTAVEAGAAA